MMNKKRKRQTKDKYIDINIDSNITLYFMYIKKYGTQAPGQQTRKETIRHGK